MAHLANSILASQAKREACQAGGPGERFTEYQQRVPAYIPFLK